MAANSNNFFFNPLAKILIRLLCFFKVDQGTLVLPHKLLTNAHEYPDIIYEYMVYVIGSAKAIRDSLKSGVSDAQIELEAKYMLKFEYELAKVL